MIIRCLLMVVIVSSQLLGNSLVINDAAIFNKEYIDLTIYDEYIISYDKKNITAYNKDTSLLWTKTTTANKIEQLQTSDTAKIKFATSGCSGSWWWTRWCKLRDLFCSQGS